MHMIQTNQLFFNRMSNDKYQKKKKTRLVYAELLSDPDDHSANIQKLSQSERSTDSTGSNLIQFLVLSRMKEELLSALRFEWVRGKIPTEIAGMRLVDYLLHDGQFEALGRLFEVVDNGARYDYCSDRTPVIAAMTNYPLQSMLFGDIYCRNADGMSALDLWVINGNTEMLDQALGRIEVGIKNRNKGTEMGVIPIDMRRTYRLILEGIKVGISCGKDRDEIVTRLGMLLMNYPAFISHLNPLRILKCNDQNKYRLPKWFGENDHLLTLAHTNGMSKTVMKMLVSLIRQCGLDPGMDAVMTLTSKTIFKRDSLGRSLPMYAFIAGERDIGRLWCQTNFVRIPTDNCSSYHFRQGRFTYCPVRHMKPLSLHNIFGPDKDGMAAIDYWCQVGWRVFDVLFPAYLMRQNERIAYNRLLIKKGLEMVESNNPVAAHNYLLIIGSDSYYSNAIYGKMLNLELAAVTQLYYRPDKTTGRLLVTDHLRLIKIVVSKLSSILIHLWNLMPVIELASDYETDHELDKLIDDLQRKSRTFTQIINEEAGESTPNDNKFWGECFPVIRI